MEDEINFKEYYYMVKKNWLLILLIFAFIVSGTTYYTLKMEPVYEARSLVVVTAQDQTSQLLGNSLAKFDMETQVQIIQSSSVLGAVKNVVQADFDVEILPIKNSNVIEISVQSNKRIFAMGVANQIAEGFVNFTINSKKQDALSVIEFIDDQLLLYEAELDLLNRDISSFDLTDLSDDEKYDYQSLVQAISVKEKLYNTLLVKKEEVKIVLQENSGNVKIIEHAQIPIFPIKPNKPLNILLGIIVGLMAGFGLAFLKETIRDTFKNVNEIESFSGNNILGSVSLAKTKRMYLEQHYGRQGEFAESIRMLRTNLLFYLKDNKIKSFVVTSPQKQDGKTIISTNLALSLTHHDKRVLMIDANLRSPSFSDLFKVSSPGLTDVISGEIDLKKAIINTKKENLSILTSGSANNYPSELFGSNAFKSFCEELADLRYDVIIIDAASLDFSETALICSQLPALVVIGEDKTSRESAKRGMETLSKVKAKVIGVVGNMTK